MNNIYRVALFLPSITSTVAVSIVWLWIFNPDMGLINNFLMAIGLNDVPMWLGDTAWSKPALVIMRVWQMGGYYMIMFLAGLQTIPETLYEAAELDGASEIQKFFRITLPLLSNTTFVVMILLVIEAFNMFESIFIMTAGGPLGSTSNPILSDELMLHTGAITSTQMERKSGKAAEVLGKASLQKGDTIIISSNTGINTVPVEAALYAKQKGLTVVCVTSKTISEQLKPRSAIGKHLCDVSDIVIDNHAPFGDGVFTVPGTNQVTGGAFTFGSLFIAQRIVLKIENLYLKNGEIPPILRSANIPGGDEFNAKAVALYRTRIPALS